jgi:hypothetical protein
LIYGGSETYLHKGVRVVGWRESGELPYQTQGNLWQWQHGMGEAR